MTRSLRVLIVEDSELDTQLVAQALQRADFDATHQRVQTAAELRAALTAGGWDVILSDYSMPRFSGLDALLLTRELSDEIPFIFVTGAINEETAVDCLKRGADDYVLKDNLTRLGPAVNQALERVDDRRERRRLEEHIRQSQRLEAIGTLASGVAHDFHNLLTVIFGSVEQLAHLLPDVPDARQSLEMIREAAQQARGVTHALLTFSSTGVTQKAPVDLAHVAQDSLRLLRRLLPASIEITTRVPSSPVWINADATQIQQILMNLAVNARDAMPTGGALTITVRHEGVGASDVLSAVVTRGRGLGVLSVADTGIGMTEEVRARIFEPFFTTKARGQGTGLGMSVIHGIVTSHHGRIEVESQPGHGTCVTVWLPCCDPPRGVLAQAPQRRRRAGSGELILVVEDNEYVRSIMTSTLRSAGYQVVQAADGNEGMAAFARHQDQARLILMDVDLPGRDGLTCLREIRSAGSEIPVIVITGSVDVDPERQFSGDEYLLRKPFQMSEVLELVARVLARRGTPARERVESDPRNSSSGR